MACPLLALPAELRARIWTFSVYDPRDGIHVILSHWRALKEARTSPVLTDSDSSTCWGTEAMSAPLRVCKQMHAEMLPVLYAAPTWHFEDLTGLHDVRRFVTVLTPTAKTAIRKISIALLISCGVETNVRPLFRTQHTCVEMLARELTGLTSVDVHLTFDLRSVPRQRSRADISENISGLVLKFARVERVTLSTTPVSDYALNQRLQGAMEHVREALRERNA